jgi:hypothetical protein
MAPQGSIATEKTKSWRSLEEGLMSNYSGCGFAIEGAVSPKAIAPYHRFPDVPNARFCPLFAVEDRLQTDSAV